MLNSIKRAGFRFRVGTSDPSRGTLVEPKYFQVLGLIWNAYLVQLRRWLDIQIHVGDPFSVSHLAPFYVPGPRVPLVRLPRADSQRE